VRRAYAADVDGIHKLISAFESPEMLLPRTHEEIASSIGSFVVAVSRRNRIEGCASLHVYASHLGEVGSVAVAPSAQGRGLGTLVVRGVEALARLRGIDELFAVTTVPDFFRSLGYDVADVRAYPEKLARYAVLATRGIHPVPKTCLAKRVAA
jgi:amino-acid N-acetyltransferase